MIDGSFIETLKELLQPRAVTVGGEDYSTAPLHNLPLPIEPPFPTVNLATLDSLVEYVAANRDSSAQADTQITCGAQIVQLISPPFGENRRRDTLAKVECARRQLHHNAYLDLENFRLQLLTQYAATADRATLLEFVSKISDSNVTTSEDDGVSQSVTAKVGVASFGQAQVPSPVSLAPIRTFEELEQPVGQFVFRLQKSKSGGLPESGLFEIDTNWQRKAAVAAVAYLKAKLPDMTVLA